MGNRIGRLILRSSLVIAMLAATQSGAAADTPLQFRDHTDFTFRSGGASALCGFDVFVHLLGDGRATVFHDKSGAIVREEDSAINFKFTVFAPSTGKSYTYTFAGALQTFYTDGGAIGSPAIVIATGMQERFPGDGVNAGRTVYEAVVIDVNEGGVPVTDFVDVLSHTGPSLTTSIAQARCDAVK